MSKLAQLPKHQKSECVLALTDLVEVFGKPHIHSGLGIRKIGRKTFECRGNIDLRFAFEDREHGLFVTFLGNHDELRKLIRSGKFD